MKHRITALVCAAALTAALAGCDGEYAKSLSTSRSDLSVGFETEDGRLLVEGRLDDKFNDRVLVTFDGEAAAEGPAALREGRFELSLAIPDGKDEMAVGLLAGNEERGGFEEIISGPVRLKKTDGGWRLVRSPDLKSNNKIFKAARNPLDFSGPTDTLPSDDETVAMFAGDITRGLESEYEKIRAIHDWIAENMYYDSGATDGADVVSALESRRGGRLTLARLFAAMARSLGIPCAVRSGYVSDGEAGASEHAWNEAYADGGWVVADAVMDSMNRYEEGRYVRGSFIKHVYFDADMEFFSLTHRLGGAE